MGLSLKKLLPVAGAALGIYNPALLGMTSAASAAALGAGIGTLISGGDIKDALKNAAIGGAVGYAAGPTIAGGAGASGTTSAAAAEASKAAAAQQTAASSGLAGAEAAELYGATYPGATEAAQAATTGGGILGSGITTSDALVGSMLLGTLAPAPEGPGGYDQFSEGERRPDYEGTELPGLYVDPETGVAYNSAEERAAAQQARRRGITTVAAAGGYIEGPGTGKSDSINAMIYQNGTPVQEARLSDGEFVMTEAAVRGLGKGNREKGAARMYEMMKNYERMA